MGTYSVRFLGGMLSPPASRVVIGERSLSQTGEKIQILPADILKGLFGVAVQGREYFLFKYISSAPEFNGAAVRRGKGIPEAEYAVSNPVERPAASRVFRDGNDLIHQTKQVQGIHKAPRGA